MKRVARTWAFINPLLFNFFSALSNFHSACRAIFELVSSGKHVNKVRRKRNRKRRRKRRKRKRSSAQEVVNPIIRTGSPLTAQHLAKRCRVIVRKAEFGGLAGLCIPVA